MRTVKTCHSKPSSPDTRPCLGAHLSVAGGLHRALLAAQELRCCTVQVFVKNQRQWRESPLDPDDVRRWHALREAPGFGPVVAHATYLINLASPDQALWRRSRDVLARELRRCHELRVRYLVVHPGATTGGPVDDGVTRVARALNWILQRHPSFVTMPLLETTAGQGSSLGRTFAELGEILHRLETRDRVGICIDTCHVFAAGYEIRTPASYESMLREVGETVGLDRVRCWHLNDSKTECGSRVDRHEHIGRGQLGNAAFRHVLADERFTGVPMIIETPKGVDSHGRDWDRVNLQRLRTIATLARKQSARG